MSDATPVTVMGYCETPEMVGILHAKQAECVNFHSVVTPEKNPAPLHAFDLRIHIGGEDWEYVRRSLRELLDHVEQREAADCGFMSGGAGGCFSLHVNRRDVSPGDYRRELEAWFELERSR